MGTHIESTSFLKRLFISRTKRPSFGIHISGDSIRSVEFVESSHGNIVGAHNAFELPVGTIKEGRIEKPADLLSALLAIRGGRPVFQAGIALPELQARFFTLSVSSISPEKIREYVALHLEEYADLSPEQAVFDYNFIPLRGSTQNKKYEIAVVAYPRQVITDYQNIFQAAGINVRVLEPEAVSVSRAIAPKQGINATVFLGEYGAWISFSDSGVVIFSKSLATVGRKMTRSLENSFSASNEEAFAMKSSFLLSGKDEFKKFTSALSKDVGTLADEIGAECLKWRKNMSDSPVGEIIMVGEGSSLQGLPEYLSLLLRTEVKISDVWKYAHLKSSYVPPIIRKDSLGYVGAIGAGLFVH